MGDQAKQLPVVIAAHRLCETIGHEVTRILRMKNSRQKYLEQVAKPHLRRYYERAFFPEMYAHRDSHWVFNRESGRLPESFSTDVEEVISYALENSVGNPSVIKRAAMIIREFNELRSVYAIPFDIESASTIVMASLNEIENHAMKFRGGTCDADPGHLDETELPLMESCILDALRDAKKRPLAQSWRSWLAIQTMGGGVKHSPG